ncbi:sigma-E factor negative regulatory protein [Phytohalomonas tamaricis]|uniref:sigma-E factor negative regulatory protein n=1 Tax=Phytohalomonas tamaricis TaxID=2081032 RepID=UPI000D0ABC15|nr:sigma-E factor negative regulatory protein [Phytohalomonas tamaricis]
MNQKVREPLSALMDGESDELEVRRILKTLREQPKEADTWRRYHLARSVMQRDRDIDLSIDLSAMVRARIEMEARPEQFAHDDLTPRRATSFSFMGSAAIAAAVSLMVITGVQVYRGGIGTGVVPLNDGAELASQPRAGLDAGAASNEGASLVDLPMFSNGSASPQSGIMQVGAQMPWFMSPEQQNQNHQVDIQQAQMLQGYLNRHVEQASYQTGGSWMPMLQASAQSNGELSSQR